MSVKSKVSTMYPGVQAFDFEITISDESAAVRIAEVVPSMVYEAEAVRVIRYDFDEKTEPDEPTSSAK